MTATSSSPKPATDSRRRRLQVLLAVAAVAVAVAVALVVLTGDDDTAPAPDAPVAGVVETREMLEGLEQDGLALGNADAPVTLTEFADMQCPFCKQFSEQLLPLVVRDYVRSGKVRVVFQPMAFLGPDSQRAARLAAATAEQNRLWDFIHLFFFNQGEENSGYADDAFLRKLTAEIQGLDVERAFAARDGSEAARVLADTVALARREGVDSTPSFLVEGKGGSKSAVLTGVDSYEDIQGPIDEALGQ